MALCCEIYGWRVVSPYKGAVIGIAFRRHGIYSISQEICTRFLRFAVLCCGYTLTDFPISIRLTSLALWQSNDCPSASKATLMNMDKYFMWIHYERLHNHNKATHNKTVCIFLGIYCSMKPKHISARKVLGGINSWFFHCQVLIKRQWFCLDYSDVITSTMASQINSLTIVYSTVFSGAYQIKYQSSTSLAFVRGIQRWLVNSRHKWPITRKCFHLTTSSCHDAITQAEIQYSFTLLNQYHSGRICSISFF